MSNAVKRHYTTGELQMRRATLEDLPAAHELYAAARAFMVQAGNPTQWAGGYPADEMLRDDVACGALWLCHSSSSGELLAVFYFQTLDDDETYREIDGAWLNEQTYGVVHRIATRRGTHGVGTACIEWAQGQARERGAGGGLRIDTHEDNVAMRRLLEKLGFSTCGTIWTYDGSPRIAFQRLN